jgi:L-ascorbate oxidase
MICKYKWKIEWYSILSKACLDCPLNETDCFRKDCISANGVKRAVITVNRMIPGPIISACLGDLLIIKVENNLHSSESTTIHWHGLKQKDTPYMDGVSMITQCPINSHTSFEYRFYANDYGTHLWHAHAGLQRADGVFGPIIIHEYEKDNPYLNNNNNNKYYYDYDLEEHVIVLNDWINETSISKFAGHHHNDGDNKPNSILINGKGILKQFNSNNNNESSIIYTPRALFYVESNKKYRFRLINAGILYCPIEFSIDNHNLSIISSDGKYLELYEVESLIIYAGERYDFILNTNNTNNKNRNYLIKAKGLADCSVFKAQQTAILIYTNNNNNNNNLTTNINYLNMSRIGKQLNPWNKIINNKNDNIYKSIDKLKSLQYDDDNSDYFKILNNKNKIIKKYYLSMEFNKINNPEFENEKYYSLNMLNDTNRQLLFTPQINNISMHMPSIPLLYKWDTISKV